MSHYHFKANVLKTKIKFLSIKIDLGCSYTLWTMSHHWSTWSHFYLHLVSCWWRYVMVLERHQHNFFSTSHHLFVEVSLLDPLSNKRMMNWCVIWWNIFTILNWKMSTNRKKVIDREKADFILNFVNWTLKICFFLLGGLNRLFKFFYTNFFIVLLIIISYFERNMLI